MLARVYKFFNTLHEDKLRHYITGQLGAFAVLCLLNLMSAKTTVAVWVSVGVVGAVAVRKELEDMKDPLNKFDTLDVMASVLGGAPLYVIYWLLHE